MRRETSRQHESRRARSRAGMTLLEVVLAVVLLSLVTTAITGAMSRLNSAEMRNRKTIGAYEVANRLMLQHLDDPKVMRGKEEFPIDYDRFRYRWELTEERATMELADPEGREASTTTTMNQANSRFKFVTVNVFEVNERLSQGAITVKGEQLATITRLYDPFTPRNPDAVGRWTQEDIMSRLRDLTGDSLSNMPDAGAGGGSDGGG